MQIDSGRVLKRLDLILYRRHDLRVAVSAGNRDDPGVHVEVSLPRLVEQPLHVPLDDQERLAVEREHHRIGVLPPHREELLA